MLIDTHAHLTDPGYGEAREIIDNMQNDNLDKIITVAYDVASSYKCVEIAKNNPNIYATVGVHPSDACRMEQGFDPIPALSKLVSHPKVVALGEIGLDYHYDDDKDVQKHWLDAQLSLLGSTDLPVSFHIRDAYEDTFDIVKAHKTDIKNGGVLHCYSGSYEYAKQYLDMGFYVSFSGSITFKNSVRAPEIVRKLPKDRLLIETDCPYLTPVPFRGKRNEPKYVTYQAQKIAEILGMGYKEAEELTRQNAYTLFKKMKRD